MVFDSVLDAVGAPPSQNPWQIANSAMLTQQEKLDRLQKMKARATQKDVNGDEPSTPEEIEAAIADVKRQVSESDGAKPIVSDRVAGR